MQRVHRPDCSINQSSFIEEFTTTKYFSVSIERTFIVHQTEIIRKIWSEPLTELARFIFTNCTLEHS